MKHLLILAICFLILSCDQEPDYPQVEVKISLGNEKTRYAGQQIQFIANVKNAEKIGWELGDGTVTSDTVFAHTYTEKGVYTVKLEASNPAYTISDEITIEVKDSIKTLITNGSSQRWNLYGVEEKSGQGCYCNQTLTFTSDNLAEMEFLLGRLQCNSSNPDYCTTESGRSLKFEIYRDERYFGNGIMIGPGASMSGYEIEVDEELLRLVSNIDGTTFFYRAE